MLAMVAELQFFNQYCTVKQGFGIQLNTNAGLADAVFVDQIFVADIATGHRAISLIICKFYRVK